MSRGRTVKDSKLKTLAGDPGGLQMVNRNGGGPPDPPGNLSPRALQEWNRIVAEASPMGTLWRVDQAVLALYCTLVDQLEQVQFKLEDEGLTVQTQWGVKPSPWIKVQSETARTLRQVCDQLGFSPMGRTRVKAGPPPDPEADALAGFLEEDE